MTKIEKAVAADPAEAARASLRLAQADYRRASAKHGKLMEVAAAAEKRLASTVNDLRDRGHVEQDVALASCQALIKAGDGPLELPKATLKQIAEKARLESDRGILEKGLTSLGEQIR